MMIGVSILCCLPLLVAAVSRDSDELNPSQYASEDIIMRDIAIIGGGSSGTYAAVNLHRLGKSVVVVEREAVLGGHTHTYTDPITDVSIDYGVQAIWETDASTDYFEYLGLETMPYPLVETTTLYEDFRAGERVNVNASSDFTPYAEQLEKYPYLDYSWDLPYPVPEDLLLRFDDFIAKYNIPAGLVYTIYYSARGFTNILDQLVVNVFKFIDASFLSSRLGNAFVPAHGGIGSIYTRGLEILGDDVLLSSTVLSSRRASNETGGLHLLCVETPAGKKLIQTPKLLVTIPPVVDNLQAMDLDETETFLFSDWAYSNYYTLLLNNTGLPPGFSYENANSSTSTYNVPELPASYMIAETAIPGLFYSWYASPTPVTQAQVEEDTIAAIERLSNSSASSTEIVRFHDNSPFKLVVSADKIREGFYSQLSTLQGRRQTWWTGAAFISHDAGVLWNFTQSLFPDLVA